MSRRPRPISRSIWNSTRSAGDASFRSQPMLHVPVRLPAFQARALAGHHAHSVVPTTASQLSKVRRARTAFPGYRSVGLRDRLTTASTVRLAGVQQPAGPCGRWLDGQLDGAEHLVQSQSACCRGSLPQAGIRAISGRNRTPAAPLLGRGPPWSWIAP